MKTYIKTFLLALVLAGLTEALFFTAQLLILIPMGIVSKRILDNVDIIINRK